ncbi:transmembrane protease serine 9-like [Culex quinquefasciatus]|uniref:transmembrane protease serine 9-like n=1 Tax=Culex quinquefasciatus TaxID=7176 RepID=UPI0018E2CD8E|nr:transmembrane protease serine 9-like [Culex quinquefasciatus]
MRHLDDSSENYVCGGTVISELYVLTADHCVRDNNEAVLSNKRVLVRLGLHYLRDLNPRKFQQHKVDKILTYKGKDQLKNDIAILELATVIEFTKYVQPACVNQEEDLTRQFGTAVGWGVDETNETSPILKSQRMPVISTNKCLESNDGKLRPVLGSGIFCAGYLNGTTVCNGDSGGGLHFERNGVWYAGFTDVHHFLPWIRKVTGLGLEDESAGKESTPEKISANPTPDLTLKTPEPINVTISKEESIALLPADCGKYLVNRIFRGTKAELYEFPWVVRLVYTNKTTGERFRGCHGSLINKRYVLTSVDCVPENYKPDQIYMGEYDTNCNVYVNASDCIPQPRFAGISSITAHSKFNSDTFRNNIALVRLNRNVEFEDNIQPICLPVTESLKEQTHSEYIVAGWGRTTWDEDYPNILQKASVQVTNRSECEDKSDDRFYIGRDVICVGSNGTANMCEWEDGAPLGYPTRYNESGVRFVQYGITSIFGCETLPSIITYVPRYMDWILANLRP